MSVPWYRKRRDKGMRKRSIVEEGLKKLMTNMFDSQDSNIDLGQGKKETKTGLRKWA